MGFIDKMRSIINGDGVDDELDVEENGITGSNEPISRSSYDTDFSSESKRSNKVVNIHATAQLQVVLVKPERFDDASTVADHLNAKRTVVLNLESANKDVARRILDFLSGVAYANDGQIKKVANCTFIITPYNVGIMGDLLDELENNGLYF